MGLIRIFTGRNLTWVWCLLSATVIAIPSLFFVPDLNMDATVYFNAMNTFRKYFSFGDLYKFITATPTILREYKSYPGATFLLYIISKTGLYTLLSFITVTLSYFSVLTAVSSFFESKKTYGYIFTQLISLFTIHYLFSMSVVRFYLAVALLLIVTFVVIKKSSRKYIILFTIPALVHPGIIPPMVLVLGSMLFRKVSNKVMYFLIITIPFLFSAGSLIQKLNVNGYVGIQIGKLMRYVNKSDLVTMFTTTKTWTIEAIVVIYLLLFIFAVQINKNRINNLDIQKKRMINVAYYFSAFTIGISPFNIIFIRYMAIAIPFTLAGFSILLSNKNIKGKNVIFSTLILIVIISILSNSDISYVTFSVRPIKALGMPLFETIKLITKY
ncbi:hypothetical protein LOX61_08280 [Latilactobacillus curvatus]|uniref:hypothetical protein n=1 Tax=Latilactobacillus curvatus TaxID=28038 RepID=UPI0020C7FB66|nr:hypothetical protein [Latilactobacillus curvatus]MCP8850483.1 hypothetical protein [Latilactobacillus curvatus]